MRIRITYLWMALFIGSRLVAQGASIDNAMKVLKERSDIEELAWINDCKGELNVQEVALDDNARCAAACLDGRIVILSIPEGKPIKEFAAHEGPVRSVAFSSDFKHMVSCGDDKNVKVWRWPEGDLLRSMAAHNKAVFTVKCATSENTVISGGFDGNIIVWDIGKGRIIKQFQFDSPVWSVAVNKDDILAAGGGIQRGFYIRLWNLKTGEFLGTINSHSDIVRCLAFSTDGSLLLSGGGMSGFKDSCKAVVTSLEPTIATLGTFYPSNNDWVNSGLFLPEDAAIVLACSSRKKPDLIECYDIRSRKLRWQHKWHAGWVKSEVMCSSTGVFVSGGNDGIRTWRLKKDIPRFRGR